MKLIFLDIDGVLNCHAPLHPEVLCGQFSPHKVALLNAILNATGAKIVLSSAWRYLIHRGEMNLAGMDWLLRSHGIYALRLVGVTETDTMERREVDGVKWAIPNERGKQISRWLKESGEASSYRYIVIDDMDLGISAEGHNLLLVDGNLGLTEADAARAIHMLNDTIP